MLRKLLLRLVRALDYRRPRPQEQANVVIAPSLQQRMTVSDILAVQRYFGEYATGSPKYVLRELDD